MIRAVAMLVVCVVVDFGFEMWQDATVHRSSRVVATQKRLWVQTTLLLLDIALNFTGSPIASVLILGWCALCYRREYAKLERINPKGLLSTAVGLLGYFLFVYQSRSERIMDVKPLVFSIMFGSGVWFVGTSAALHGHTSLT